MPSSTSLSISSDGTPAAFKMRYARRLKLPEAMVVESEPTYDLLCQLQEAHLTNVPFENLAQHGGTGGHVALDIDVIADKVLNRNRGGFCLELNSIFRTLLEMCGFTVTATEAVIFKNGTFDVENPTHFILMVKTHPSSQVVYYVDVAAGELPIQPIEFIFDKEQVTPELMRSRFIRDGDDNAILQVYKEGEWQPKILWKISSALAGGRGLSIEDLQPHLERVTRPDSNFSRKLIVCMLSRDRKRTLAGNTFKVTGPPRFGEGNDEAPVQKTDNIPVERVREILRDEFSIPWVETIHLDLKMSIQQDPTLWVEH